MGFRGRMLRLCGASPAWERTVVKRDLPAEVEQQSLTEPLRLSLEPLGLLESSDLV